MRTIGHVLHLAADSPAMPFLDLLKADARVMELLLREPALGSDLAQTQADLAPASDVLFEAT